MGFNTKYPDEMVLVQAESASQTQVLISYKEGYRGPTEPLAGAVMVLARGAFIVASPSSEVAFCGFLTTTLQMWPSPRGCELLWQ